MGINSTLELLNTEPICHGLQGHNTSFVSLQNQLHRICSQPTIRLYASRSSSVDDQ